jgi:two-component system, response regulator
MNITDVIIIEDDAGDAELTVRALKKNNEFLNVLHLWDGQEALDFLLQQGKYADIQYFPKLVFLDLKLPKVNGLEVLQIIKKEKKTCTIPVVVFSSSKEQEDIKACYLSGANSYLVKPLEYVEYTEAVSDAGTYWLQRNQPAG